MQWKHEPNISFDLGREHTTHSLNDKKKNQNGQNKQTPAEEKYLK